MYELIHTEDRAEFQRQLHWALNPQQCPDSGQRIDGKNVYQKVVLGIEFSERRQRIFRGIELHSEDEEEGERHESSHGPEPGHKKPDDLRRTSRDDSH